MSIFGKLLSVACVFAFCVAFAMGVLDSNALQAIKMLLVSTILLYLARTGRKIGLARQV